MFWRYTLIDSRDMTKIGRLRRRKNPSLTLILDKPGSLDFEYPMNADHSGDITKYQTGVLAERFNFRATVARQLSGLPGAVYDPIWSGHVLNIREDWTKETKQISCVGWLHRLSKRNTRRKITWANIDDSVIIRDLLGHANRWLGTGEHPSGTGSSIYPIGNATVLHGDGIEIRWPSNSIPNLPTWIGWGGAQPNEGIGGATAYVAQLRSLTIDQYTPILPNISSSLIEIENGCDINLDPISRLLTVHRKYQRVKNDVVVGFRWGPRNLATFERNLDGEQQTNFVQALGSPGTTMQYTRDTVSMDSIGPVEEFHDLGGVVDNNILLAFTGAEILVRSNGEITYGVLPFNYSPSNGVPEPCVDYRVGDLIKSIAKHPVQGMISNMVRVFGMTFTEDNGGNEKLQTLQLSP